MLTSNNSALAASPGLTGATSCNTRMSPDRLSAFSVTNS
jgi:hypothetical protein